MVVLGVVLIAFILAVAWWAECEINALYRRLVPLERRVSELEGGDTRG